jgi:hypothetical protein
MIYKYRYSIYLGPYVVITYCTSYMTPKKNSKTSKLHFIIKKCIVINIDANIIIQKLGESMVGVPKRIVSFYIHWIPSLKHVETSWHIHIEILILFIDRYITKFNSMHRMSNLKQV